MLRSGNPALKGDAFIGMGIADANTMTIQGAVTKTFILLFIVVCTAVIAWSNPIMAVGLLIPFLIIGAILAIVTMFKKQIAPITAPIYAGVEGFILGAISAFMEQNYPGIVIQAVFLTFGTLFCMLAAYKTGLIKITQRFRLGVIAATGGIAVFYAISFFLSFFGIKMPIIYQSSLAAIGFSVFVVIIAALNLVLDFDLIETGEEVGAPKYMEWYGAFALMITLIWLYIEILRLLAKLRER